METITIKRKLAEDALSELKLAQADHFVQSTQEIIDELEAALRPPIQLGTILIATNPCRMELFELGALIVGKEYKVHGLFCNMVILESECDSDHHFTLDTINEFFTVKPAL